MRLIYPLSVVFVSVSTLLLGATGCGDAINSIFGGGSNNNGADDSQKPPGFGGGNGDGGTVKPCIDGLCKQQQACSGGGTTSITGTVYDPAGANPLYNVLVYVPNHPDQVQPITHGATCDRCGNVSGDPLITAVTDTKGNFTLVNVPVGKDIPLIIQVGKWRRKLTMPTVESCVENKLTDKSQTRLPRNKAEGDIPKIALTTGGADTLECFLRKEKLGLDDAEFTQPDGDGSVNFYAGSGQGNMAPVTTKYQSGASFPKAQGFWGSADSLKKYDLVLLSCEGAVHEETKGQAAYDAMYDYISNGGRMFATHWHRVWFTGNQQLNSVGTWNDGQDPAGGMGTAPADIITSFPKGHDFQEWLGNVNALNGGKGIDIVQPRHNLDAVDPKLARDWITMSDSMTPGHPTAVEYMTANAPVGADDAHICGRTVFSDLHVSASDQHGPDWPSGCTTSGLTPQEKALEFLFFDLSACVQNDNQPPQAGNVK